MAGGEEMDGLSASDCVVGSLVWVQRRNGSWWSGQIPCFDELIGSDYPTYSRSKLWLSWSKEKMLLSVSISEFNGYIERVKSAKGMPLKKREKYARTEDVILHALELERQMLKKQYK
ncbi:hypothetical protein TSUD_229370 [Trifolium subterraneum]|uniref:PWWP domain-containing protein n=1 Tax=Trifolium subterraneum TaxID=3900 RepID=A0A2Z6ML67_TRISU|nr:hypothetical protein TSUD_229370 [Trifolium subterraneum]